MNHNFKHQTEAVYTCVAGNRTLWEFGWAYGVGWGAAIFLFGAVVLLLCDQEEEEIYYKERTIIHAENDSRCADRNGRA